MIMKPYIEKCLAGEDLTAEEAAGALELIMSNQATDAQIAGLLIAIRAKGETVGEIVGFARTMREHAVRITVDDPDAIDMCGTGGDGKGTFNISTVATLVVAGAGVTVAKHGNRSVSSRSGSADVLAALGVNLQVPAVRVTQCINEVGVGFLFAPLFHPAMKFVAKTRADLAVRTIFNLLGPLTNPAGVRRQLVGTFSDEIASRLAGALSMLGTTHACVVHSDDGLDEVSVLAPTVLFDVDGASGIRQGKLTAAAFGLRPHTSSAAQGGTAEENAELATRILSGEKMPARDIVLVNAALGLVVAGRASGLQDGMARAAESIDSGQAFAKLKRLVEFTATA